MDEGGGYETAVEYWKRRVGLDETSLLMEYKTMGETRPGNMSDSGDGAATGIAKAEDWVQMERVDDVEA